MMYNRNLVVAVKANGKILREHGDTVYMPFGQEYSLLIKNLHTQRVVVSISIDGKSVTENTKLVIDANSSTELKRTVRNDDNSHGNAFKFIERTEAIENGPRGIGAEDGLIRVEYEFERESYYSTQMSRSMLLGSQNFGSYGTTLTNQGFSIGGSLNDSLSCNQPITSQASYNAPAPGITVPGSIVEQHFDTVRAPITDGVKHTIVLRMVGSVDEVVVTKPLQVKTKLKCVTCGNKNSSSAKFCGQCGTSLQIV